MQCLLKSIMTTTPVCGNDLSDFSAEIISHIVGAVELIVS